MELKNAGLTDDINGAIPLVYLNYQIWFYEVDNSIEYHYGDHNITDTSILNEEGISSAGFDFYNNTTNEERAGFVTGSIENPVYMEFASEEDFPDNPEEVLTLDDIPQPNTVYRFAVNPLSIEDTEKTTFSIYPNPVTETINLSLHDTTYTEYTIHDITGRNILSGSIDKESSTQINVASLQSGTYIFKIGSTTKKFIKK